MNINLTSGSLEGHSDLIQTVESGDGLSPIALPEGFAMAAADYARTGSDLTLTAPDGQQVVIADYFAQAQPPALTTPDGAMINGDLATRLAGPLAPGQVAQAAETAAQEPIGRIDTLDGTVSVTHADGTRVELAKGDPVFQGDILETGPDGAIGVVLADSSVFSLGESGRMVLDEMVYDPGGTEGQAVVSLLTGAATFVSGQIAKFGQDAMVVQTPVATIGIRGTKVFLDTDGTSIQAVNLPESTLRGETVGEIVLMSPSGDMLGTINSYGGGWQWTPSLNTTPSSFQLSPQQVGSILTQVNQFLPRTLEEKALDIMDRLNQIREQAAAAREAGDDARAEQLEAEAQEAEAQLEQAVQDVEQTLGFKVDLTEGDGPLGEGLDAFDTAAGGDTTAGGDTGGTGGGGTGAPDPFLPAPGTAGGATAGTGTGGGGVTGTGAGTGTGSGTTGGGATESPRTDTTTFVTSSSQSPSNVIIGTEDDDDLVGTDDDNEIYGLDGDDELTGGAGDDMIDGGDDVEIGDTVIFSGPRDNYEISYDWASDTFTVVDLVGTDGTDTVTNVETFQFSDSSYDAYDLDLIVSGNGELSGLNGNDLLTGGAGDDVLTGGAGNDDLYGGAGFDTAVFSGPASNYTVTPLDANGTYLVTDNVGSDGSDWVTGVEAFQFGFDTLLANELNLVVEGSGEIYGTDLSESLVGGTGNDTLYGLDGDDWLRGGAGTDRMDGGDGIDTLVMDGPSGLGGTVTLGEAGSFGTFTDGWNQPDQVKDIENVVGTSAGDVITGNSGNNTLDGGAGNDQLNGGAGDDVLIGGSASDNIDGGAGTDRAIFSGNQADYTISHSEGVYTISGADGTDFVSNVEIFQFDDGNIASYLAGQTRVGANLTGTAGNDTLTDANFAQSVMVGLGGDDTINGGNYNDTLYGDGSIDYDFASSADGWTSNEQNSPVTYMASGGVDGNGYIEIQDQANTVPAFIAPTGLSGNLQGYLNGQLSFSMKSDLYDGGQPVVTIEGDAGTLTLDVTAPGTNWTAYDVDLDATAGWVMDGDHPASLDEIAAVLSAVSGVTFSADFTAGNETVGLDAVRLTSADGNDTLRGGSDNDTLYGEGGDDTLEGGSGTDAVYGGDGNDTFNVSSNVENNEIFDGGDGNDRIYAAGTSLVMDNFLGTNTVETFEGDGALTISDFGFSASTFDFRGIDAFVGVEAIDAGNYNDIIYGTDSADPILRGGSDNDTLYGEGGDDTLEGGSGTDAVYGGDGDDTFNVSSNVENNEIFDGGDGNDRIYAAGTSLVMDNFLGTNTVETFEGDGALTISDFGFSASTFDFRGIDAFVGVEAIDAGNYNDIIYGTDSADPILRGGSDNDTLYGEGGDDTLEGGSGTDAVYGGDGNDTFNVSSNVENNEIFDGGDGNDRIYAAGTSLVMDNFLGTNTAETFEGDGALTISDFGFSASTFDFRGIDAFVGVEAIDAGNYNDIIYGTDSADPILRGGSDNDTLYGEGGDDTLEGGSGTDAVYGGDGNDTFNVSSNVENNEIFDGGDGNDRIYAAGTSLVMDNFLGTNTAETFEGDGALTISDFGFSASTFDFRGIDAFVGVEAIDAGNYNDIIYGTDSADPILRGGSDNDTLYGEGGDDILDGGTGTDSAGFSGSWADYVLSADDAGTLSVVGADGSDTLTGFETLLFDDASAQVVTASVGGGALNGGTWVQNAMFGLSGDDNMTGGNADDRLMGGLGNDTLDGGTGADMMDGGAGNDILYTDGDDLRMDGGAGSDELAVWGGEVGFESYDGNQITSQILGVEAITLSSGATLYGTEDTSGQQAHTGITADQVAANLGISGGTLILNSHNGDSGASVLLAEGEWTDTGSTEILYGRTYTVYEAVESGDATVTLKIDQAIDDGSSNAILGTSGNDVLVGTDNDDEMDGLAGDDWLTGGLGADTLTGGSGEDVFSYLLNGMAFDAAEGGDTIIGFNPTDDALAFWTSQLNGLLPFGSVHDLTTGPSGWDGNAWGSSQVSSFNAALDGLQSAITLPVFGWDYRPVFLYFEDEASNGHLYYTDSYDPFSGSGNYGFSEVATLQLDGNGGPMTAESIFIVSSNADGDIFAGNDEIGDTIDGTSSNDQLHGLGGDDVISGYDGNDILFGDAGTDTLSGGSGNDLFYGGETQDFMDGGTGDDLFVYVLDQLGLEGGDMITGFGTQDGNDMFRFWPGGDGASNLALTTMGGLSTYSSGQAYNFFDMGSFYSTDGVSAISAAVWAFSSQMNGDINPSQGVFLFFTQGENQFMQQPADPSVGQLWYAQNNAGSVNSYSLVATVQSSDGSPISIQADDIQVF
ncbi:hypothetical protein JCM17960_03340 [Magnetospira thiophila]